MLPETVKVGGVTYAVEVADEKLTLDGEAVMGLFDFFRAKIRVRAEIGEQEREATFWHEVAHALAYDRGLEFKGGQERGVEQLSRGLFALFRDNSIGFTQQKDAG
jgi:hypothetical protein